MSPKMDIVGLMIIFMPSKMKLKVKSLLCASQMMTGPDKLATIPTAAKTVSYQKRGSH